MKMSKRCIRIPIWIGKLALSSVKPNDYNPLCMIEVSRVLTINVIFIMWMDLLTNNDYCNRPNKRIYGTRHIYDSKFENILYTFVRL